MNDKQIANLRADLLQKIRASGADVEEVKQALTELAGDVETCAHMADIAPEFSELENYAAGDLVYNEGVLYRFTADHSEGAWTDEDAELTDIAGNISDLQPVDAVTAGNMHPVTSNAVNVALTQETVTVTKESGDTYTTMIARLFAAMDFTKLKPTSKLVRGVRVYNLTTWTTDEAAFIANVVYSASDNYAELSSITISSTPSFVIMSLSGSSIQSTDHTNDSAPNALTIYY